jgi:hypothetical protein
MNRLNGLSCIFFLDERYVGADRRTNRRFGVIEMFVDDDLEDFAILTKVFRLFENLNAIKVK